MAMTFGALPVSNRYCPGFFGGRSRIEDCPCCQAEPDWRMYPTPEIWCTAGDCGLHISAETIQEACARWNRREGEERAFARGCAEGPL